MLRLVVSHVAGIDIVREVGCALIVVVVALVEELAELSRSVSQLLLIRSRVFHMIVEVNVSITHINGLVEYYILFVVISTIAIILHSVRVAVHLIKVIARTECQQRCSCNQTSI